MAAKSCFCGNTTFNIHAEQDVFKPYTGIMVKCATCDAVYELVLEEERVGFSAQ